MQRITVILLASIFVLLAVTVFVMESTAMDDVIDGAIHSMRSGGLTEIVKVATHFGSAKVEIPLALAAALWLLIRHRALDKTAVLLGSLLAGYLFNVVLKTTFHRPRPELDRLVEQSGYSFPSGHAMVATAFYGMFFYLIWRMLKDGSRNGAAKAVTIFAVFWLLMTGFCRVYLGVHYTTDVLSGYAAGGIVLLLGVVVYHRISKA